MNKKLAKTIRLLTIPPFMVLALLLLLYFGRDDFFSNIYEFIAAIVCLMIIPILAYPLAYLIPSIKSQKQQGARKLAFVCSFIGYTLGYIYALTNAVSSNLMIVFLTYFLSIIILSVYNVIIKVKASGHACSICGPLVLVSFSLGIESVIWCVVIFSLVIWSSLVLKRHTIKEILYGSSSSVFAFAISALLITFASIS